MALPFGDSGVRDARTLVILAKSIYRELMANGFEAADVIALAGELVGQVAAEVRAPTTHETPEPPASQRRVARQPL
jgi:hypothetical protein